VLFFLGGFVMGQQIFKEWCEFMRAKDEHGKRLHINDVEEHIREGTELAGRREKEKCLEESRTAADYEEAIKFFASARRDDVLAWFESLKVSFKGFEDWCSSSPKNMSVLGLWTDHCILGRGIHMRSLSTFRAKLPQLVTEPFFKWQDLSVYIMRYCPPGDLFASSCRGEDGPRAAFLSRCFVGVFKK
jgi:hypothetical protein